MYMYFYGLLTGLPLDSPEVGAFICDRIQDLDEDPIAPPHDNVMVFSYEGGSSTAGSLSSLNTNSSDNDQDYDYLNDWGPKFSSLAVMYRAEDDDWAPFATRHFNEYFCNFYVPKTFCCMCALVKGHDSLSKVNVSNLLQLYSYSTEQVF